MAVVRLLVAGQVAALLGLPSGRSFLARVRKLRSHQFPAPVPGLGRRWDRNAVEAWLDHQHRKFGQPNIDAPEDTETLIRRAREMQDV